MMGAIVVLCLCIIYIQIIVFRFYFFTYTVRQRERNTIQVLMSEFKSTKISDILLWTKCNETE